LNARGFLWVADNTGAGRGSRLGERVNVNTPADVEQATELVREE
jgi:hypothetical protein